MRRCALVVCLAVLGLCLSAGAVEFGLDLGTRAVGIWPGNTWGPPVTGRGGVMDLLADVPLSKVSSINLKVGSFIGTNSGETRAMRPVVNLSGVDARVAFMATWPIVKDAVSAYVGVGATYCWFRYSSGDEANNYSILRVSENGITLGVPAGLKLRLSRRFTACIEMEVPDYGVYHDAVRDGYGETSTLSWWQYGTLEPNVSAALYLAR